MKENGLIFDYKPRTIFAADGQWTYGREPVIRPMPDGSLVCWIYSGGPREPDDDNVVLITRSTDRGESWTAPEVAFAHGSRGVWGTEIFTEGDVPFGFVHTLSAACHYLELRTAISYTHDSGKTWTEPVAPHGVPANMSVRQGIVLADGSWVFPVYWQECDRGWDWSGDASIWSEGSRRWFFSSGCIRSTNHGKTWSLHGYLAAEGEHLWEPNIVETSQGLLMLMRAEGKGVLYRALSTDGGMTWSTAEPSEIPCPSTKLTLLKQNDRILLLHNPTDRKVGRKRIKLLVSEDDGQTWPIQRRLVEVEGENTSEYGGGRMICYPHGFLSDDEQILYVAVDSKTHHYLLKIPYADFS